MTAVPEVVELENVSRLSKDILNTATLLPKKQIRSLVDAYYALQHSRITYNNQVRELKANNEPYDIVLYMAQQFVTLEKEVQKALNKWTDGQVMGKWAKGIVGIGPVIAAGLLTHIDIRKAPYTGAIWRLAGLDPTQKWIGRAGAQTLFAEIKQAHPEYTLQEIAAYAAKKIGTRVERLIDFASKNKNGTPRTLNQTNLISAMALCPYNQTLKTLLVFKLGESFVKFQNHKHDYYGKFYRNKKAEYAVKNDNGEYAEQAKQILASKNFKSTTDAFKHLSAGRLPPAQIHARARRYAVKLFISHFHDEWYRVEYGKEPPLPYAIAFLGHNDYIPPPAPVEEVLKEAAEPVIYEVDPKVLEEEKEFEELGDLDLE